MRTIWILNITGNESENLMPATPASDIKYWDLRDQYPFLLFMTLKSDLSVKNLREFSQKSLTSLSIRAGEPPDVCGVIITLSILQSGLSVGSGSSGVTSRPAAAINAKSSQMEMSFLIDSDACIW